MSLFMPVFLMFSLFYASDHIRCQEPYKTPVTAITSQSKSCIAMVNHPKSFCLFLTLSAVLAASTSAQTVNSTQFSFDIC